MNEETNNDSMLKDVLTVLMKQSVEDQAKFINELKSHLITHHKIGIEAAAKSYEAAKAYFEDFTNALSL